MAEKKSLTQEAVNARAKGIARSNVCLAKFNLCLTGPQERQEHAEDVATHLKEALADCFEQRANIAITHVDIGQKLKEKGMEHVWDIEVWRRACWFVSLVYKFLCNKAWPPTFAVGKLAAAIKKKKKQGHSNVFVCVDLKERVAVLRLFT